MDARIYMGARAYWLSYVEQHGGRKAVAERLGTPYATIAAITNGQRGIGRALADRFAQHDPSLDRNRLIWVRPEQRAA